MNFLDRVIQKKDWDSLLVLCDRNIVTLPQSQLGFIDAIVLPLFSVVNEFFPGMNFTLQNLKINEEYYKGVKEKYDKKKVKDEIKEEEEDKINNSDDSKQNSSVQISKISNESDESNK